MTEQPDTAALVKRVREAIAGQVYGSVYRNQVLAALDCLTAALERTKRERSVAELERAEFKALSERQREYVITEKARAQKAEELLKAYEEPGYITSIRAVVEARERAQKAEAVVEAVRYAAENGESAHIRAWCSLALAALDEPVVGGHARDSGKTLDFARGEVRDEPPTE